MRASRHRAIVAVASVTALAAITGAGASASPSDGAHKGPSSSKEPYVLPVADGVSTVAMLSVGDTVPRADGPGSYSMVGIPDGLGARKGARGSLELFMNHELRVDQGIARKHGQTGAFVSHWDIDRRTLAVERGEDLIRPASDSNGLRYWDYVSQTYRSTPSSGGPNPRQPTDTFPAQDARLGRFCSSSLTAPGQLYNKRTGRGYTGQLYFANEETGDEGRVFGVTTDGQAQQLPRLGLFSWENTLVAPNRSDTTLAIGQEDNSAGIVGQQWVYVGKKSKRGNAFARAGLTNGVDSVLDLLDESVSTDAQFRAKYGKGKAVDFDLAEVDWDQSGARQNAEAAAEGLTLNRPEDGAWDPRRPNDYYFLTTAGGDNSAGEGLNHTRNGGGLWRMRFEDIESPELGGTLELLLDGSEDWKLNAPDNMDIDSRGNLLIQEDPGNNDHLARILTYRISDGARGVLAQFDPELFAPGKPLARDEESSGIIDAEKLLGRGWYLFDAQVHRAPTTASPAEHVEEGQMLALRVKSFSEVYGGGHHHGDDDE